MSTGEQTQITKKSTSRAYIFLGLNLISWWSKKKILIARSNIEFEYISLANSAFEVLQIQSLLTKLRVQFTTHMLFYDNLNTIVLSHNSVFHAKTKHMKLDILFLKEKVFSRTLMGQHVPSFDPFADLLTKPLSPFRFIQLRVRLHI